MVTKEMNKYTIATFIAAAVLLSGILTEAFASTRRNPYGESEDPKRAFKVHFDTTKFPELPKCTWARRLRHLRHRQGEVEIILDDGRKITTTYSNIAVEE